MRKIIIATHHQMAEGLKDTLEYIVPNTVDIYAISAYMSNVAIEKQIESVVKEIGKQNQLFVFTDLLGGSVNQAFMSKLANNPEMNIELITGVNLPVIMSLILTPGDNILSKEDIQNIVDDSRKQIIYVNDALQEQQSNEEDE